MNDDQRFELWIAEGELTMISGDLADQGKYPDYPPVSVYNESLKHLANVYARNWCEASQLKNDIFGYGTYTPHPEMPGPETDWPFRRYTKLCILQWLVPLDGEYYWNIRQTLDDLWEEFSDEDKDRLYRENLGYSYLKEKF